MGNNQGTNRKHLVIVGGSFSGLILAQKLSGSFNITILEQKDYFEWIGGTPLSLVNSEYFENNATVLLHDMIERDQLFGQNVHFLQGTLTQILDSHRIKIKRTDKIEELQTLEDIPDEIINYDFLALGTGNWFKINEPDVKNVAYLFTKEHRAQFLHKYAEEIKKASSILVVGGGATGSECLGEIQRKYGDAKTYGLMNSQDELGVGFPETVRQKTLRHFLSKNTRVYLGKRYDPNGAIAKEYDFVLMGVGLESYTPFMDNDNFQDCKNSKGKIYVNEFYQVTNQNPLIDSEDQILSDPVVHKNIFCYGDAGVTRMNEVKNIPAIRETADVISYNLKQSLTLNPKLKSMPYAVNNLGIVYLNKWNGSMGFNKFGIRLPCSLMAKSFIQQSFMCFFKNKCGGKCRYKMYNGQVDTTLGLVNNLLGCCSCSNRKNRNERREYLRKIFEENKIKKD